MTLRTTASYPGTGSLFVLDANGETTKMLLADDFRHVEFQVNADNSADYTIQFYESNQEERPDLTAAVSATNEYNTIQVVNKASGNFLAGNDGAVIEADGVYGYELQDNGSRWVGAKITTYAAGDASIKVNMYSN